MHIYRIFYVFFSSKGGTGNPYAYPNLTADYVTKWVAGAQSVYNLTIDYVGIWNEV